MITQIITGFLFVSLALFLYVVFVTNFFELHLSVQSNEVARHAMIMQNSIMASPQVAYYDGNQLYKGVFDMSKLSNFQSAAEDASYENMVAYVKLRDLKTDETYEADVRSWQDIGLSAEVVTAFECVADRIGDFADDAVNQRVMHLFDIFNYHTFNTCYVNDVAKRGFHRGLDFGATIRTVDPETGEIEYHPAIMSISVYEFG
jgi:hypothetical protein